MDQDRLISLVNDFEKVIALADRPLPQDSVEIEFMAAPHKPPSTLPTGKVAVYMFFWRDLCLKVGKAGQRSHARYSYQHYTANSSVSNLARSLVAHQQRIGLQGVTQENAGHWIRNNSDRANILLNAASGIHVLNLLEAFAQCRFKPVFEGFESQR